MAEIFSFQGRSNISQYWVMTLVLAAIGVVALVATAIFAFVTLALGTLNFFENLTGEQSAFQITPSLFTMALLWTGFIVIATWLWLAMTARRLRDAGWNPWLAALVFLPIFNLIAIGVPILASISTGETWLLFWSMLINISSLIGFVAWIVFGCIGSKK